MLILLIPVSISTLLYTNMEKTMIANANRSNFAMLEQVKRIEENRLAEIDRMAVQIANQPKLQTLWNLQDGKQYLQYAEAVAALNNIRSGSDFIQSFYIHLKTPDIILTPDLKTDADTFFSQIMPYNHMTPDQVKASLLTGYHFKTFYPSAPVSNGSQTMNVIAATVSLPLGEANVRGTLVLLIDEQQILDFLNQIEWANSGSMYILDKTGQVLMSTAKDKELPPGLREQLQGTEDRYRLFRLNGETSMLSYTSGPSGWQYVSLVPKAVVLRKVEEIKTLALVLLVLAMLGGTAASYWMAYRSYSPIRKLVYSLMKSGRDGVQPGINEYEYIQTSIAQTIAEDEELKKRHANYVPVIRAYFLSRLLRGQESPNTIKDESLRFMGVDFPHAHVCVVVLEVDDPFDFIREDTEQEWSLVRFILFNLSSELMGLRGYVTETDRNRLALLLNVADTSPATKREIGDLAGDLKRIIEDRFRMRITVTVSGIREGLQEAGRCYLEALSALDYRIIHGSRSIIHYEQVREINQNFYHYPVETEVQLINQIKDGDYESASGLLDELYERNIASGAMAPELGKCLFFDLLSTMLKVMNALKIDEAELFKGRSDPAKYIASGASAESMLSKIKELCRFICESVQQARTDQQGRLNDDLKRYMQEHCSDCGLSLNSIADHFGMTPQYISRFFKKQNGVNLTDYIVQVRIQEAKRLLETTNWSILKVSQQVGYATDIGFIRVFKKLEGITPGKYREMAQ